MMAYLGLGSLFVKRQTCIDFGGNSAGDDSKDLFSKFDQLVAIEARC